MANKKKPPSRKKKMSSSMRRIRALSGTNAAHVEEVSFINECTGTPTKQTPQRAHSSVLGDLSNSPAVLQCSVPTKTFSRPSVTPRRRKAAAAGQLVRRRLPDAGNACNEGSSSPNKKARMDFEELDQINSDSDEPAAECDLSVEFDANADGLDMINKRHIVSLPHVLRQYESILSHSRDGSCTGGRMVLRREDNTGTYCTLHFECYMCGKRSELSTDPAAAAQMNQAVAWGALSIGAGYYQAQEFLAVLNVNAPSPRYYRKCERKVGEAWKSEFEKLRKEAVEEEKEHAISTGSVIDGMPAIAVMVDGAWSKRTFGHGYNAKSGVACIIGAHSNKILYVGVENKFCKVCIMASKKGDAPQEHPCNGSFRGPSTAMESSIIVRGLTVLHNNDGVWCKYIIGDGDSNVFTNIRQFTPKGRDCEKLECANHATRGYTSKLHAISKDTKIDVQGRNLLTPLIPRLTSAARGAIRMNAGKSAQLLRRDLWNGPRHVLGDHSECDSSYCSRRDKNEPNYVEMAKATGILDKIEAALLPLYNLASKLRLNATTNMCEGYMSKVSKLSGGKRVDFSTGPSYGIRCLGAALLYMRGPAFHLRTWESVFGAPLGSVAEAVLMRRQINDACRRQARERVREARNRGCWTARKASVAAADDNYGATNEQKLQDRPDVAPEELERRKETYYKKLQDAVQTEEDTRRIEENTRGQGDRDDDNWYAMRNGRVTASWSGDVLSKKATTPLGKLVKSMYLKTPLDSLDHIVKGHVAERLAIQKYEQRFNRKVEKSGIFIRPEHPELGASLDGKVGDDGIVEVKNFSKLGDKTILETFENKKLRKNLRGVLIQRKVEKKRTTKVKGKKKTVVETETVIEPNKKSKVYSQVQMQLALSDRKWCDLILHCDRNWECYRIERDESFWRSLCKKLKCFYWNALLPELVDSRLQRDLPPREPQYVIDALKAANKPLPFDVEP